MKARVSLQRSRGVRLVVDVVVVAGQHLEVFDGRAEPLEELHLRGALDDPVGAGDEHERGHAIAAASRTSRVAVSWRSSNTLVEMAWLIRPSSRVDALAGSCVNTAP